MTIVIGTGQSIAQVASYDDMLAAIRENTPPNTRWLYDNVYIDETEIANIHWLEYLHYLAKDSTSDVYQRALPDTAVWGDVKLAGGKASEHYLRYPAYRYFPVVGISREQAQAYCKWRAKAVNIKVREGISMGKIPVLNDLEWFVEYRLPTKAEWEFAAAGHGDVSKYGVSLMANVRPGSGVKKCYEKRLEKVCLSDCVADREVDKDFLRRLIKIPYNVYEDYQLKSENSLMMNEVIHCDDGPDYIYDYPPNSLRIYNIIGNVAEWVQEEGIVKGGSFQDSIESFSIQTDFYTNAPANWIGFRCIGILHIRRK